MKYLISFLIFASILLYSCGNDNTTNNSNSGGETVLFSLDSLSIYLNSSVQTLDTNFMILNSPNLKITFNCNTNSDSVNSLAFYRIFAIDTNSVIIDSVNNNISSLTGNHQISFTGSNNYSLTISLQINRLNTDPFYIKLKDIKVLKIN